MKANTHVWVGIRNVGDTAPPQTFSGTLGESLMWIAQQLGKMYMKNAIQIGIARTESEVLARLDLKRGMSTQKTNELEALLAGVIAESGFEAEQDEVSSECTQSQIPGDNYVE